MLAGGLPPVSAPASGAGADCQNCVRVFMLCSLIGSVFRFSAGREAGKVSRWVQFVSFAIANAYMLLVRSEACT